ncbi:MAG: helix-turn-helix domain-containing protein [Kiloniellales bacterium]
MRQTFSTLDQPEHRQLSWWQEVLSEVYYNLEVDRGPGEGLRGKIVENGFEGLSITRFAADGQRVMRTSRRIAADDDDHLVFVFPRSEQLYYSHAGRNGFVGPGGYVMVQTRAFYELSCPDGFENITIKVQAERLRRRLPFAEDHCGCSFPNDRRMAALVTDFADWLMAHHNEMPPAVSRQMSGQLEELIVSLLGAESDQGQMPDRPAALHLRRRIEAYAREHLVDPDLSAKGVAETFGISTSYLHRLFRSADTSFWHWVLGNRLQHAYERLTHPNNAHRSIAEIAYASGFSHQAHFSTLFRRQFGVAPRQAQMMASGPTRPAAWSNHLT